MGPRHAERRLRRRPWPTWLIVTTVLVTSAAVIGVLLWSFNVPGADGDPLIDAPAASVLVAVIVPGSVWVGRLLRDVLHQGRDTLTQVQSNAAVTQSQHREVLDWLGKLDRSQELQDERIERVEEDVHELQSFHPRHAPNKDDES